MIHLKLDVAKFIFDIVNINYHTCQILLKTCIKLRLLYKLPILSGPSLFRRRENYSNRS